MPFFMAQLRNMKTDIMENQIKIKLFLVDDDALFLKTLEIEFSQHADFTIQTFSTGELCVENLNQNPDVIILDYHLDGIVKNAMTGIETLDKIKKFNPDIPVVMLSSQSKIGVAVDCMNHNAFDYAVKNQTGFMRLQRIINSIFRYKQTGKKIEMVYGEEEIPFQLSVLCC